MALRIFINDQLALSDWGNIFLNMYAYAQLIKRTAKIPDGIFQCNSAVLNDIMKIMLLLAVLARFQFFDRKPNICKRILHLIQNINNA